MEKILFPVLRAVTCLQRGVFPLGWKVISQMRFLPVAQPRLGHGSTSKRKRLSIRSNLDGGGNSPASSGSGKTRLFRTIEVIRLKLDVRIKELRKDLPMKVLFFLVGFYCATAFATVIGQTGDWDILSAGLAVVVVEGIGALMYRVSAPFIDSIKILITMFNYWKAGLTLGLFLDSFNYVDGFLGIWNVIAVKMSIQNDVAGAWFLDVLLYWILAIHQPSARSKGTKEALALHL